MGELHYKSKQRHSIIDTQPTPLVDSSRDIIVRKIENLISGGFVSRQDARPIIIALRSNDWNQVIESIKNLLTSQDNKKVDAGIHLARACKATELKHILQELSRNPVYADKARFTLRQLMA